VGSESDDSSSADRDFGPRLAPGFGPGFDSGFNFGPEVGCGLGPGFGLDVGNGARVADFIALSQAG
jgi:hypothetical protein